jgi:alpha-tubulin suppressor-like RCC1 family protein
MNLDAPGRCSDDPGLCQGSPGQGSPDGTTLDADAALDSVQPSPGDADTSVPEDALLDAAPDFDVETGPDSGTDAEAGSDADACVPLTACPAGVICGNVPDGCGGEIGCGASSRCAGRQREVCAPDKKSYVPDVTCGVTCSAGTCLDATHLDVGFNYGCARLSDGSVRCWGANDFCQIKSGGSDVTRPQAIVGVSGAVSVAVGYEAVCALRSSGAVWCWGGNNYGGTGRDKLPSDDTCTPAAVVGVSTASALVGGGGHFCAKSGSKFYCWGRNEAGQASGDGLTANLFAATESKIASGASEVIADDGLFSCLRAGSGLVSCWGRNGFGQLGIGSLMDQDKPVSTGLTASAAWLGPNAGCALTSGGVRCWGANTTGQLGDGTTVSKSAPVLISQLATALVWRPGGAHGCGRFADGSVRCAGDNTDGALGTSAGSSSTTPTPVFSVTNVDDIRVGGNFSCVLARGTVRCWGRNDRGQLGDGTTVSRSTPAEVKW